MHCLSPPITAAEMPSTIEATSAIIIPIIPKTTAAMTAPLSRLWKKIKKAMKTQITDVPFVGKETQECAN